MLTLLVQIHVEAYMLTLAKISQTPIVGPREHLPVDTFARVSSSDTLAFEPILLEDGGVPGPGCGRTEKNPATDLEHLVQCNDLFLRRSLLGIEPIHRVHELYSKSVDVHNFAKTVELTIAMVRVDGLIRAMTSMNSSV